MLLETLGSYGSAPIDGCIDGNVGGFRGGEGSVRSGRDSRAVPNPVTALTPVLASLTTPALTHVQKPAIWLPTGLLPTRLWMSHSSHSLSTHGFTLVRHPKLLTAGLTMS